MTGRLPRPAGAGLRLCLALFAAAIPARAETGYDLWLRYAPLDAPRRAAIQPALATVVVEGQSKAAQVAAADAGRDQCLRYFQTFSKRPLPDSIGPGEAPKPAGA